MCSCHRCPEACHHPNADLHPQPPHPQAPHPAPSAEGLLNDDDLTPSARLSRTRVGSRRVPRGATRGHVAPRSGSAASAAGASRACSLPPAEAGHRVARRAGLGEGGEVGLTERGGARPTAARRAPHPQVHFAGSTSPAPGEWSEERGQQALRTQCPPGLCGGSVHGPPGAVGLAEVSLRTGGSPKPLGGHSLSRSS